MELILIFLVSILMGAFNFGFFLLGYHLGGKKTTQDGVTLTEQNQEFVKEMAKWRAFGGN